MPSLETRIAALEMDTTPTEPLTIVRRFVSPGLALREIYVLRDNKGNEWQRQPSETEQALIDRASLECVRNQWGVTLLCAG